MLIHELIGVDNDPRTPATTGDMPCSTAVGVEIELEKVPVADVPRLKWWRLVGDGSLRNSGAEFIFVSPLSDGDIVSALDEFNERVVPLGVEANERCSVHVHVDVRDCDPDSFLKMVCVYTIFEEALFRFAGEARKQSNFCMPVSGTDAGDLLQTIIKELKQENGRGVVRAVNNFGRYAALNVNAVTKFGSLEFRAHEGTTDAVRIRNWITLLLCLRRFADTTPFTVEQLPNMLSASGPAQFAADVFGEHLSLLDMDAVENGVWSGVREVQSFLLRDNVARIKKLVNKRFGKSAFTKDDMFVHWSNRLLEKMPVVEEAKREEAPNAPNIDAIRRAATAMRRARVRQEGINLDGLFVTYTNTEVEG